MPPDPGTGRLARNAAVSTAVSTAVYLALVMAAAYAMARRDRLQLAATWAKKRLCRHCGKQDRERAEAQVRREISWMEHGYDGGPP